jgi:vacuolar-type H+-ATPase subunit I/STV1
MPKINKEKAARLLAKGDKLATKGKNRRALKKFKKAHKFDPNNKDILDRLVKSHDDATKDWEIEDMVESVSWVMEKQELDNPSMKMLHAQLTPEGKAVSEKIVALFQSESEEDENKIAEEIKSFGTDAIYPLISTILQIKKGASEK